MNSGNTFDDEKTVFIDPKQYAPGEDHLIFFLENDPENKLLLTSDEPVTIGRSIESDFFIESKTVSRKHLTLTRRDSQVEIEIHGRNGIYLDNELRMGPLLKVTPPVNFTIGDVPCGLEPEIDEDKTVILTPDQKGAPAASPAQQAQPEHPEPPPPAPEQKPAITPHTPDFQQTPPFDPSPNDTFIPQAGSPVSNRPETPLRTEPPYEAPPSPPPPQPPAFEPSAPTDQTRFEPVARDKSSMEGRKKVGFTVNKNNLIIIGIIALTIISIVLILLIVFNDGQDNTASSPDQTPASNTRVEVTVPASEPSSGSTHQAFIDLADELIKSGDIATARDVLDDIPEDSPHYRRAQTMLQKLPEN